MDAELQTSMFNYYNKKAPGHEELYTYETEPVSTPDHQAYFDEIKVLADLTGSIIRGKIIDIGCGTGFWLPYYYQSCNSIYLFDQSLDMISACRTKAESLSILDRCSFLAGDFWNFRFNQSFFDSALISFFFSHIPAYFEYKFITRLLGILKEKGTFLILDSVWNKERKKTRNKEGNQQHILEDGTKYDIYKRYFSGADFRLMKKKYNIQLTVLFTGNFFIAARGVAL